MSLIKWEPFDDFDRMFKDFGALTPFANANLRAGFDLAADVYEDENNVRVEMNLPGLKGEDIDVEVDGEYLKISGRREEVQEKKEKSHYAKEIRRGSFERVVHLPTLVEAGRVEAEYKDGVLKVQLPKQAKSAEQKIKVKVK